MLKRIFVDSNSQNNYCQLVSVLWQSIHGPSVLFVIGANLERLDREWSELTAGHHLVFDPLHGVKKGSTFVSTLFVRSGEECSNNFCVTAMDTPFWASTEPKVLRLCRARHKRKYADTFIMPSRFAFS